MLHVWLADGGQRVVGPRQLKWPLIERTFCVAALSTEMLRLPMNRRPIIARQRTSRSDRKRPID